MDVVVHVSVRQQQLSLEILCQSVVRRRLEIVRRAGLVKPLILLAPEESVRAVVVVPGSRHADLEEVGVTEHRVRRRKATSGEAVDADFADVDPAVLGGQLPDRRDVIGESVVAHVAVVGVVKRLGPLRRAHMIELYDDESELGQ